MKKYLVGSRAFFSGMEGFSPKDQDFLLLESAPLDYEWRREQHLRGVCTFFYKIEPPAQMVQRCLNARDALQLGKFLVPEVAAELGMSVDDIRPLETMLPLLDEKHRYYEIIFRAYMTNGSFTLTEAQRLEAYKSYTESRKKEKEVKHEPIS